jgi:hypothetical protein
VPAAREDDARFRAELPETIDVEDLFDFATSPNDILSKLPLWLSCLGVTPRLT